jgi:hypothetical protein
LLAAVGKLYGFGDPPPKMERLRYFTTIHRVCDLVRFQKVMPGVKVYPQPEKTKYCWKGFSTWISHEDATLYEHQRFVNRLTGGCCKNKSAELTKLGADQYYAQGEF